MRFCIDQSPTAAGSRHPISFPAASVVPPFRHSINLAGRHLEINYRQSCHAVSPESEPDQYLRAKMVEAFCATWKLVDSQNFDDYMKALGEHLSFVFK